MEQFTGNDKQFELNDGCKFPDGIEGYWRTNVRRSRNNLPFPVACEAKGFDRKRFIERLIAFEKRSTIVRYRGCSTHRWTNQMNGSIEFKNSGWRVPVGYRVYIEGGVLPSRKFYLFLTGEDLNTLPDF